MIREAVMTGHGGVTGQGELPRRAAVRVHVTASGLVQKANRGTMW